uniref:Uncharacterized protein n=1 Tax=Anopheles farauti TaxID=69004 RepID=A0A182QQQ5_9DIPT
MIEYRRWAAGGSGVRFADLPEQCRRCGVQERKFSEHDRVQDHPEGPHIGRFAPVRLAAEHIGRNVRRTAALIEQTLLVVDEMFAEEKVRQHDSTRPPVQHDVVQLQIAVDDVACVQLLDHLHHLVEQLQRVPFADACDGDVSLQANTAPDAPGVDRLDRPIVPIDLTLFERVIAEESMLMDHSIQVVQHREQRELIMQQHLALQCLLIHHLRFRIEAENLRTKKDLIELVAVLFPGKILCLRYARTRAQFVSDDKVTRLPAPLPFHRRTVPWNFTIQQHVPGLAAYNASRVLAHISCTASRPESATNILTLPVRAFGSLSGRFLPIRSTVHRHHRLAVLVVRRYLLIRPELLRTKAIPIVRRLPLAQLFACPEHRYTDVVSGWVV